MHKYLIVLAMMLVSEFPLFAQCKSAPQGPPEKLKRFQAILDSIYAQHPETRGIAIYLHASDKNWIWYSAVGSANKQGTPLQVMHPVNIASVTKTYVAAAIMRLVEQGKFTVETPISAVLTKETTLLLQKHSYEVDKIRIKHLLSNTSGIYDFVNTDAYQKRTQDAPEYKWTIQEQLNLAMQAGKKTANPGERFEYSETNYLLLAEMLAFSGKKPFCEVLKQALKFDSLALQHTWFLYQEQKPVSLLPMAEQTAKSYQVNSLVLNPSFDAFGGGGLASTVEDMANFGTALFEGKIFESPATIQQMTTEFLTNNGEATAYCFGLAKTTLNSFTAYGHGGFWGTHLKYIPELKLSVGVYVLERDAWPVYNQLIGALAEEINKPE